jgi:16S rRNA (adenine1518-N6/adenine1519-N6)-dimethyltransferase
MRAKQSLGQNFLINQSVTERMISLAGITREDTVLEIGPGRGILTRTLLRNARRVIAVEKDDTLVGLLKEQFRENDSLDLVHADILDCDLSQMLTVGMKVVANLPYNIGTQFIMRLVEYADRIGPVVVMLQKEVAERVCARLGEKQYSALSVIMSSGFDTVPGFQVGPGNFSPRPKVDSQVVKLVPKGDYVSGHDLAMMRKVIFCAFSQRRKVLRNTLLQLPYMKQDILEGLAAGAGINLRSRPQEITVERFHALSLAYEHYLESIR